MRLRKNAKLWQTSEIGDRLSFMDPLYYFE